MAIPPPRLRVGEATFDLTARTVVVTTVASPRLESRLAEVEDAGADVVMVISLPIDASTLGTTVEHIRSRSGLAVVVEVTDAAAVTVALGAGAGGVAAPEAVVDDAYREALSEGDGTLFLRAASRSGRIGSLAGTSGTARDLSADRVAIEPGPLSADDIATFVPPLDSSETLILSTSEQGAQRRHAALALGIGRGWPVVRLDEAPTPGDAGDPDELLAAIRVIRMIDAIRAADTIHPSGAAP